MHSLTQSGLKELLRYDPETGGFTWLVTGSGRRINRIAGTPNEWGYILIQIDGKMYRAHRLAWLYQTGNWPTEQLDHKDLNKANNSWHNLREATQTQNNFNKRKYANNKSGYKGVSWHKEKKKWTARIKIAKKYKFLGYHDAPEQAHAAYCTAASQYHQDFARTN